MLRHAIPPARFFSQVPNEILRHPRLSSDAVRLLTWQLSLPEGDNSPLSKTAAQAGIGRASFARAKRELKAEGYLHEWREQCGRGRWGTRQLVSNVPLSATEAAGLRDGGGEPGTHEHVAPADVHPTALPPTALSPTVGEPTARSVGSHPSEDLPDNTSNPPRAAAAELLSTLGDLDRRLARIPRGIQDELTAHLAAWLTAGHTPDAVREHITLSLPSTGRPVLRPGGLLRYLLRDVSPVRVRAEPRVASMRECASSTHVQPLLFRPIADETHCGACRTAQATTQLPDTNGPQLGALAVRAALRGY
ncbi:hypothetical protein ACIBI4_09390 [Streptomyces sp. NPDC050418]|uniref:hypothetical protein n=1 Tax=Streptomyces sp. NPDC050418 TaxID=3365612 RepID=UPI0037AEA818